ncbi:MAG: S1C family serine protease [Planctomycetota bacterium]
MRWAVFLLMVCVCGAGHVLAQTDSPEPGGPFGDAIAGASQRVVKLYGATAGREKAYGSGVLISRDGRIVTTLSLMLEGRGLRAVLPDGSVYPAEVSARDEQRQLALLKIEARGLPFFELSDTPELEVGDWVIAAANPFKVADGPEPVSVSVGVLAGRTMLKARHRTQDFSYDGPVLLTDVLVSTPGSAGGALVDERGRLAGLIGRAVIDRRTNTWCNYALPVEQVAAFVAGEEYWPRGESEAGSTKVAASGLLDWGIRLFDVGGRTRPAYVERVRPGSPAWNAGLVPDDLVVAVNDEAVVSCEELRRYVSMLSGSHKLTLVVKRGDEVLMIELEREQVEP